MKALAVTSIVWALVMGSGAMPEVVAREQGLSNEPPGKLLFQQYCVSCHGAGGKGDGPLAGALRQAPADLTGLARAAGGKFPFWEVMRIIDGTRTVRAHGESDMPVWGQVFRDEAGWAMARRAEIQGKLTFLTEYLMSLQEP